MATLEQAMEALRAADKAGNVEDARRLAQIVDGLRNETPDYGAGDYAATFAGGVNRGLVNMLGAPVDLVNLGLSKIGLGTDRPIGGSRSLYQGADALGAEGMFDQPAQDTAGRMIGRVGEEIGASALPAAGIMGAAMRTPAAARGIWGAFANPIKATPGRAAVGELAAATGAGAGAAVAQEAAPGSRLAETVGQVVGGVAPAALVSTPTSLATRAGVSTIRRFSPAAQKRAGRDAVSDLMGTEMTSEASARLSEADRLRKEMPGFEPSLGEATGSEALLAQQRRIEGQATGQDLETLAARKRGSGEAVDRFAETSAPKGGGGPLIVVDTASKRIDDLRGEIARQAEELTTQRQGVAGKLLTADRPGAGQAIRDRLNTVRDARRQEMNALADDLGIADADVTVQFQQVGKDIADQFKPDSIFEDLANYPEILRTIRQAAKGTKTRPLAEGELPSIKNPAMRRAFQTTEPPKPVTFNDLKALRERVSDDLLDAMGAATPSRKKVRLLTMLKQQVDEAIETLTRDADPDLASRYKQFRDAYFERYIEPFEQGAAFKVRQRDGRGFYRTPDEKVASAFFEPGNVSAARQFRAVFGDDPAAVANLEATALDSLRDSAVRDGVIQPKLFEAWTRRHRSVLDEFPGVRQAVDSIGAADQGILARQAQLEQRARQIEDQFLTKELTSYSKGSRTPESVMDAALKDPRKMRQLTSVLRDRPEAMNALRRHVWDQASTGSAEDIARFMQDNTDALRILLTPQHLDNLRDILAARIMLERTQTPTGAAFVPRPLAAVESALGQGLPQLSSRLFAFKSGRMQKGYLAVDSLMRGLRGRAQTEADEVLKHALYDPALARDFAQAVRTGMLPEMRAKRLQARLFALGLPYLDDSGESPPEADSSPPDSLRVPAVPSPGALRDLRERRQAQPAPQIMQVRPSSAFDRFGATQ